MAVSIQCHLAAGRGFGRRGRNGSFQALPLLQQLLWFPESCLHILEQSEGFALPYVLAFEYQTSTDRAQSHRQGSGPHEAFSARVANKRTVPSLRPACSLCTSPQPVLLAQACAAAKAGRSAGHLQVTAAQAAGRHGGELCWRGAWPQLFLQPIKAGVGDPELVLMGPCGNIPIPSRWEAPECPAR